MMTTRSKLSERKATLDCSCGRNYGKAGEENNNSHKHFTTTSTVFDPDASFVHLSPSLLLQQEEDRSSFYPRELKPISRESCSLKGLLKTYEHLDLLKQVATNSAELPPSLCLDCVQRIEKAVDADTERLKIECLNYRQAVVDEERRQKGLEKALRIAAASLRDRKDLASNKSGHESNLEEMEQLFRSEIESLRMSCQQHEEEISQLQTLLREQGVISKELDQLEYATEEEKNSLELEARAFDNDQEQLFHNLEKAQDEVERLSSTQLRLPSALIDLRVDKKRGLMYPLINELRLAYRPKGAYFEWTEIQVAWSLAAQLLLIIGTIFDFQSQNWKIVPLSHCAKLIYHCTNESSLGCNAGNSQNRKVIVYNLGHPKTNGCKALLAWNALLYQMVQHTKTQLDQGCCDGIMDSKDIPNLPFAISPTKIGNLELPRLDENDDTGWSRAIHYMSSDLLWLSECASAYLLQKVLLTTASLTGEDRGETIID